jgi:hypothetical protein
MEILDMQMFKYFFSKINSEYYRKVYRSLLKDNNIAFKWFTITRKAQRMSGEMNTSASNGFANLILAHYLCHTLGLGEPKIVVEGDDALYSTPSQKFPEQSDYEKCGFLIKMLIVDNIGKASFCGMRFHPEAKHIIGDIPKQLLKFGWTTREYALARTKKLRVLLRAKAFSLYYAYRDCPILGNLGYNTLRLTSGVDIRAHMESRNLGEWERQFLKEAFDVVDAKRPPEISPHSRVLVEELYGISVNEQLSLEAQFDEWKFIQPIEFPTFENSITAQNFNDYVYSQFITRADVEMYLRRGKGSLMSLF